MKIAPIMKAFGRTNVPIAAILLHTGQHYDHAMKASFFDQLGIPEPDIDLGVGSGSHAVQTAEIMKRFEVQVDNLAPHCVLVVGDVNSTIACALVAAKKSIPVVHVEAGLRSFDRQMPEEINRVLTDQLSDLLFTTERDALVNLQHEGISEERVRFVGNVMIDTLHANLSRAIPPEDVIKIKAKSTPDLSHGYGVVTLHRPSNVDDQVVLQRLLKTLSQVSERLCLFFPIHPRTRATIEKFGFETLLADSNIHLLPPLGYLEMLGLMSSAKMVLSDSGGIQEETTALGVPCITLRENTERPITVDQGTNTIVGSNAKAILDCAYDILESGGKQGRVPELWDGHAAERITDDLLIWLQAKN
jgi:UDP-N-acetylglucosamine 2-epimerase (non-hydrolysing)